MKFDATKQKVANRGTPPDGFLTELVAWGRLAPAEIFAPNENLADVYALVKGELGPWQNLHHRRAAMLEVMRVHAGFESSWNWNEGVDRNNARSMAHPEAEETGIFQVSFDSLRLGAGALMTFAKDRGIVTPAKFIGAMKLDHKLALEFYGRLVRVSVQWAGPLRSGGILPYLRRDAVVEFGALLNGESEEVSSKE